MPLPLNSESVFIGEHLLEDTASILMPLSKNPRIGEEKTRRFLHKNEGPPMETPPYRSHDFKAARPTPPSSPHCEKDEDSQGAF